MKPESLLAFTQLQSLGMEELSSEEAAQLLSVVDECPECHGEWVLFYETINTLSHTHLDEVTNERSQNMWLVCLEHARETHTFSISSEDKSEVEAPAQGEKELSDQKKTEKFLSSAPIYNSGSGNDLDKLREVHSDAPKTAHGIWNPTFFVPPRAAFGMAMASVALLAATYFLVPQSALPSQTATLLPRELTISSPATVQKISPENAQLAAYATHSNFYMEPFADSVAPQLVSYSMSVQTQ